MYVIKCEWSIDGDYDFEYYVTFSLNETKNIVSKLKAYSPKEFEVVHDSCEPLGTWYASVDEDSYFTIEVYRSKNEVI